MGVTPLRAAIRPPLVDGLFYPARREALAAQIDELLDGSATPRAARFAVISPHAGYEYAGAVMAAAYRAIADRQRAHGGPHRPGASRPGGQHLPARNPPHSALPSAPSRWTSRRCRRPGRADPAVPAQRHPPPGGALPRAAASVPGADVPRCLDRSAPRRGRRAAGRGDAVADPRVDIRRPRRLDRVRRDGQHGLLHDGPRHGDGKRGPGRPALPLRLEGRCRARRRAAGSAHAAHRASPAFSPSRGTAAACRSLPAAARRRRTRTYHASCTTPR